MSKDNESYLVTGQRLGDGAVVFLAEGGEWSELLDDAEVAEDIEPVLRSARADQAANRVVDVHTIPARREGQRVVPSRFRELLRATGPTVRPDLQRARGD